MPKAAKTASPLIKVNISSPRLDIVDLGLCDVLRR